MGEVGGGRLWEPFGRPPPPITRRPPNTTQNTTTRSSDSSRMSLSNRMVNEIKVGKTAFGLYQRESHPLVEPLAEGERHHDRSPRITFTGFLITGNQNHPRSLDQDVYSVRDDLTYSFNAKGRHDVRTGGEYLQVTSSRSIAGRTWVLSTPGAARCRRRPSSRRGSPTRSTSIRGTWRRSPRSCAATPSVSENSPSIKARNGSPLWAQDDWQIVDRLTLNLGVRYDVGIGIFANDISFPPFQDAGPPGRLEQRAATARVCVPADRSDGHPWRVGDLLRGRVRAMPGRRLAIPRSPRFGTRTTAGPISPRTRPTAGPCRPMRKREPPVLLQQQQCAGLPHP